MKETPILTNLEWVAKARSTDTTRVVLTGVNADRTLVVATDGHRLHLAPNAIGVATKVTRKVDDRSLQPGLWSLGKATGSVEKIEGNYPDWTKMRDGLASVPFSLVVWDRDGLIALCRAAEAGNKTMGKRYGLTTQFLIALPASITDEKYGDQSLVSPLYLRDAIEGMPPILGSIELAIGNPLSPIVIRQSGSAREAIVMPIRRPEKDNQGWNKFGVHELVKTTAEMEAAKTS